MRNKGHFANFDQSLWNMKFEGVHCENFFLFFRLWLLFVRIDMILLRSWRKSKADSVASLVCQAIQYTSHK